MREFFQDADGRYSSTRLAFLLWAVGALVAWLTTILSHGSLQVIPDSVIWTIGALMTGKAVQSFAEQPK